MVFWRDRIIHSQWGRAGRANVAWRLIQKMWKDKLRSWVNLGQLEVSVWFWATCIYSSMGDYIWRIMIICLRFDFFLFMVLLEGFIFYSCIPAFATRTSSSNDDCLAVFLTIPSRLFKCTRIYGIHDDPHVRFFLAEIWSIWADDVKGEDVSIFTQKPKVMSPERLGNSYFRYNRSQNHGFIDLPCAKQYQIQTENRMISHHILLSFTPMHHSSGLIVYLVSFSHVVTVRSWVRSPSHETSGWSQTFGWQCMHP